MLLLPIGSIQQFLFGLTLEDPKYELQKGTALEPRGSYSQNCGHLAIISPSPQPGERQQIVQREGSAHSQKLKLVHCFISHLNISGPEIKKTPYQNPEP